MEAKVKEIAECCICTHLFTDPKMLPCIHTFCLKCLNEISDKAQMKPGDAMPCPLCRTNFILPAEGMAGLKRNFFMEGLVEIAKISKPPLESTLCQICTENGSETDTGISTATLYCVQCQELICDRCGQDHQRFKALKDHQIVPLGSPMKEDLIRKRLVEYCDQHKKKEMEMYCFNCEKVICMMCFAEEHKSHECSDLEKVVEGFRKEILADLNQIEAVSTEASDKVSKIANEQKKFQSTVEDAENTIIKRGLQLKERVDECVGLLLNELNSVRLKGIKEMEIEKEEIERHRIAVESLVMYFRELITKGSSAEIPRGRDELRCRIQDIKDNHSCHIQRQTPSKEIFFVSSKVDDFLEMDNIVGSIEDVEPKSNATSSVDDPDNGKCSTTDGCAEHVESLLSDKKFLDEIQPQLIDTMKRLNILSDFSSKICLQELQFLFSTVDPKRKSRSGKVGDILASAGLTELFRRIFDKHLRKESANDDKSDMKYHMILLLSLIWDFTDKSKLLCIRVFKSDLISSIVSYLDLKVLDPMKTTSLFNLTVATSLMAILHNTLQKVPESSQVLRRKRAIQISQRFRDSPCNYVALYALILQAYLVTEDEIELLSAAGGHFLSLKTILEGASVPDDFLNLAVSFSPIEIISALNLLAANDENKLRIVEAGLLPCYIRFLGEGSSVEEQAAAAEGLSILSSRCLHDVEKEPCCAAALRSLASSNSERVRHLAEEVLLNFKESRLKL